MFSFRKICWACLLAVFVFLQLIAIMYLVGWINFKPIENLAFPCREKYHFSKLVLSKNDYKFDDSSSCVSEVKNRFKCVYSDQKINSYYNYSHPLDSTSNQYLTGLTPDKIYYTNNLDEFLEMKTIKSLLDNTIFKVKSVAFKVVFDNLQPNYILIITSYQPDSSCDTLARDILGDM
jgi:hypothetical protein